MTEPTREAEHREKAVEAVMKAFWFDKREWRTYSPGELAQMQSEVTDALQAADPHLERMYFERFAERMLGVRSLETAAVSLWGFAKQGWGGRGRAKIRKAVQAALDSIREGEDV